MAPSRTLSPQTRFRGGERLVVARHEEREELWPRVDLGDLPLEDVVIHVRRGQHDIADLCRQAPLRMAI